MWVVRVGWDDGELPPWHYMYVYSIGSRLIMIVRHDIVEAQRGGDCLVVEVREHGAVSGRMPGACVLHASVPAFPRPVQPH